MALITKASVIRTAVGAGVLCSLYLGVSFYQKYNEYVSVKKEISMLETQKKQLLASKDKNGSIKAGDFNTEFYQNSINAYFKVNNIDGATITPNPGHYKNTAILNITYPSLNNTDVKKILIAFSELGYISDANATALTLNVIPFSKEDAIAALNDKKIKIGDK
ncbi:MAG: hypothetical protein WCW84_06860 [Sulfurimonas sp.]|jgi:hypothetical protein